MGCDIYCSQLSLIHLNLNFQATLKSRGVNPLKLKPNDSWLGSLGREAVELCTLPTEADGESGFIPLSVGKLPLAAGGKIKFPVKVYIQCLCL